jgi:hypothetical protein
MHTGTFNKLSGQIEADETFIGGKARNMHKDKRFEKITGRGPKDVCSVMLECCREAVGLENWAKAGAAYPKRAKAPLHFLFFGGSGVTCPLSIMALT